MLMDWLLYVVVRGCRDAGMPLVLTFLGVGVVAVLIEVVVARDAGGVRVVLLLRSAEADQV